MKLYLLLFCCISIGLWAQTPTDSDTQTNFTTKDINFSSRGVSLAGTVYIPEHPLASVVLVHGSGKETRMDKLASFLAKNDIAVITYDKRGVGKSGGVYVGPEEGTNNIDSSNLNLLALDANAAGNALIANLPSKHGPLGMMGFSQAGWIIPIAAEKNSKIKFMVLFSGPVVNTLEQLRFQFYTEGKPQFWDTHTEAEAREHIKKDADRYQFAATDPVEVLSKISIKGLWLFGGKDVQIPVGLSVEHLNELKAKGKLYEYHLFPELGHNTSISKSQEPINLAIQWIKDVGGSKR